jgi:hypothetical protein
MLQQITRRSIAQRLVDDVPIGFSRVNDDRDILSSQHFSHPAQRLNARGAVTIGNDYVGWRNFRKTGESCVRRIYRFVTAGEPDLTQSTFEHLALSSSRNRALLSFRVTHYKSRTRVLFEMGSQLETSHREKPPLCVCYRWQNNPGDY